jgi:signal peptidase I
LRGYAKAIGIALLIAVAIRGISVEAFKIASASMLPTLQIGDYVLVNKLRYALRLPGMSHPLVRYGKPQPGDVIVFSDARDPNVDYIKRVVAVEGERVEIRDKELLVNGAPRPMANAYFTQRWFVHENSVRDNFGPTRVPPGRVFVLGDNRDQSVDSRYWGFVDLDDIEGKALLVYWSADGDDGWVRWERLGKRVP